MTIASRRRFPVTIILLLSLPPAVAGAQPALVTGTVTATGLPVRSASVTFQDAAVPPNVWTTVTDSAGHYQVNLVLTSARQNSPFPSHFTLGQNYPNPFTSNTVLPYSLSRQSAVELTVYDILGRVVRRIAPGLQAAGSHAVLWDGTNTRGQRVAEGVYFYTLTGEGVVQSRKMILGGAATLAIPPGFPAAGGPAGTAAPVAAQGGPFSVRIDDSSGTSPWIGTTLISNIGIQGDTTLDFAVSALPVATVVADSLQQLIRGFGAANILPWRPDMTTAEVLTAFGKGPGQLGFTILRLRVPYTDSPTDFGANVPSAQLAESMG
ncbi:MAG TPA: FlgD immunoglobulin-like domain containing protein, partial [Bacteroidota bacterium]|nr:FlgD immunoglobulin-like domain containing protein [Bacteroidota bacterium]